MDVDKAGAPFGYMRLTGGRYDRPGLPVSAAAELERYSRLVTAVAHHLYLEAHPKRRRVPRGFDDGLDLRLADVDGGSVVPVLVRPPRLADDSTPPDETDWHEEARRLVNEALSEVGETDRLPRRFPREALTDLAQFGRSLQDGEAIELADSVTSGRRSILTKDTRRRIQKIAQLDELEIETVLQGHVTGVTSAPPRADVVLDSADGIGRKVEANYSDPAMLTVLGKFLGHTADAPLVALTVVAVQGSDDTIIRIADIIDVEPVLPREWAQRLSELARLDHGRLTETSEPPSDEAIRNAMSILTFSADSDFDRPGIFPSAEGGIQLEWRTERRTVEIEILNVGDAEAVWFSGHTDEIHERHFAANQTGRIPRFIEEALRE